MIQQAPSIYPIIEYDQANDDLRVVYDDIMQTLSTPFIVNWFKCQAGNPTQLRSNWEKVKGTSVNGSIPPLLKQLIFYAVSKERGCKYCTFLHGVSAQGRWQAANPDQDNFLITEHLDSDYLPGSYKTAIRIVTKCALDPQSTTDEDFEELEEEGFSIAEIQELMAQADLANLFNTVSDISGIPLDRELLEAI